MCCLSIPKAGFVAVVFALALLCPLDEKPTCAEENTKPALHGTVFTPDGQPAVNAVIGFRTFDRKDYVNIHNNRMSGDSIRFDDEADYKEHNITKTDKDGKFSFPYFEVKNTELSRSFPPEIKVSNYIIGVVHESGYQRLSQFDLRTPVMEQRITLKKWGRIEGTAYNGTKPAGQIELSYKPLFFDQKLDIVAPDSWFYHTTTADDGTFVFEKVPAGEGIVQWGIVGLNGVDIEVQSDQTTTARCGGNGRPVIGKLVREADVTTPDKAALRWKDCTVEMTTQANPTGFSMRMKIPTSPEHVLANRRIAKWRQLMRIGSVAEDGTFRIDNVPNGDWQIEVEQKWHYSRHFPNGMSSSGLQTVGKLTYSFSMDAIPNGVSDEPLDVGTLTIEKVEPPERFR